MRFLLLFCLLLLLLLLVRLLSCGTKNAAPIPSVVMDPSVYTHEITIVIADQLSGCQLPVDK